jgi:hypothetical protein
LPAAVVHEQCRGTGPPLQQEANRGGPVTLPLRLRPYLQQNRDQNGGLNPLHHIGTALGVTSFGNSILTVVLVGMEPVLARTAPRVQPGG